MKSPRRSGAFAKNQMIQKGLENMRIAIVLGTRPEIVKMSPIILECERLGLDYCILHTGQHYSYNMDKAFFDQLQLPEPKCNLDIRSGTHAEETGRALIGIEKIIQEEKPTIVLVQGDTNTALAGALAAVKLGVSVGHVESGLRSYDRCMPEEVNRVLTDHVSNLLFAPTERAEQNLLREGIASDKIYITGNTIVDCLIRNTSLVPDTRFLDLDDKSYFLLTLHRQENVDDKERLKGIFEGLKLVYEEFGFPIVYPMHPRTRKRMNEFNLKVDRGLTVIEPVDYLTFLGLEQRAKLILTDSGGVQEEACILRVPCVTLRYNTERPETIDVGANILAGTRPGDILEKVKVMLDVKRNWENPFGDGTAAKRIVNILAKNFKS
jgi:UDP-N-acetylglucosamine 2-epimerase (non-hydrolysing)